MSPQKSIKILITIMALSNCSRCKFYSAPQHYGDVGCSISPYYYWLWWATSSNLEANISENLPVDGCSDFDLHPDFKRIEINISLTQKQWQELASKCNNSQLLEQIQEFVSLNLDIWMEVESEAIRAISFNQSTSQLKIKFTNGSVYQYDEVPFAVFDAFTIADSKGKYFNRFIDKYYSYQRIS